MISEISLPLQGKSAGLAACKENAITSGYLLNVRPRDTLEGRIRLGKRPGLKKAYSQQIGGDAFPIVWIGSITTID